jgi:hypothetical protein
LWSIFEGTSEMHKEKEDDEHFPLNLSVTLKRIMQVLKTADSGNLDICALGRISLISISTSKENFAIHLLGPIL